MRLPSLVMVNDYLQVWCEIKTPEALLGQVLGDPHSPGRFRVVSASLAQHCVTLNQNTYIFFSLHSEFPYCLDRSSWKFWRLPSCLWVSSWQRYEQAWKKRQLQLEIDSWPVFAAALWCWWLMLRALKALNWPLTTSGEMRSVCFGELFSTAGTLIPTFNHNYLGFAFATRFVSFVVEKYEMM